jgi:hypothetical protein
MHACAQVFRTDIDDEQFVREKAYLCKEIESLPALGTPAAAAIAAAAGALAAAPAAPAKTE